jgi:hypothetical protein
MQWHSWIAWDWFQIEERQLKSHDVSVMIEILWPVHCSIAAIDDDNNDHDNFSNYAAGEEP